MHATAIHWDDAAVEGRRIAAEFFGSFIVTLASVVPPALQTGFGLPLDYFSIATSTGIGAMIVAYALGNISGAHANPIVTLAFALRGDFPWRRVAGYVVSQFGGSFAAAALIVAILAPGRAALLPHMLRGSEVACGWEIVLTAMLVLISVAVASEASFIGPESAIAVGAVNALDRIVGLAVSGASMNPARTIAPIVVAGGSSLWWVYLAGPLGGLVVGLAAVYATRGASNRDEKKKSRGSAKK